MHFSGSLFACFLHNEGGSDGYKAEDAITKQLSLSICDAKMISGLRLLSWQLKNHGNSLNCHGKVVELYYQISVGTLCHVI